MTDELRQQITNRLAQLHAEYAAGEQQLAALQARTEELHNTMLRISGAIQVLDEMLSTPERAAL